jgi:7-carboxy-7-deazaguanine synthase
VTTMTMPLAGADVPASDQLYLAQVFGPTFQGEGPSRGVLANFVRFAGCNLHCSWCDSKYTWSPADGMHDWCKPVPVAAVLDYLTANSAPLLVITGGEPLLHQRSAGMAQLLRWAAGQDVAVEFETNGTQVPDLARLGNRPVFNVSAKLANAGDPAALRLVPPALAAFTELSRAGRARFKFVAQTPAEVDEIAVIVDRYGIAPTAVWVMPEGTSPETVLVGARALADPVIARGWNLTQRDHVLLWRDDPAR